MDESQLPRFLELLRPRSSPPGRAEMYLIRRSGVPIGLPSKAQFRILSANKVVAKGLIRAPPR